MLNILLSFWVAMVVLKSSSLWPNSWHEPLNESPLFESSPTKAISPWWLWHAKLLGEALLRRKARRCSVLPLVPLLIVPLGVRLRSPNCELWAQLFRLSESGPTKRSFCGYNAFCEGACWSVHASILPWWTAHLTKAIHAHTQGYTIGQLRIRKFQRRIRKLARP